MKSDREIMREIRKIILENPLISECLSTMYIIVNDGEVLLSGEVATPEQQKQITQAVVAIPGVRELLNELKVQPRPRHRQNVDIDWATGEMDVE